jgi:hypothetical protein
MTEYDWSRSNNPHELFQATSKYPGSKRERRRKRVLLACECCRRVWDLLEDDILKRAIELAERDADNYVRTTELTTIQAEILRVLSQLLRVQLRRGTWASGHPYTVVNATCNADVPNALACIGALVRQQGTTHEDERLLLAAGNVAQSALIRDIFGNPFRPITFSPDWLTSAVVALAQHMYESRDFSAMPILADALQDAGCENADVLDHCRKSGEHVRGCWVVDLVLEKT